MQTAMNFIKINKPTRIEYTKLNKQPHAMIEDPKYHFSVNTNIMQFTGFIMKVEDGDKR